MSLALLLPAGLAALAAVLLPLLIHLARRSEHRPTMFAALRWLARKPKPRRRIRFDEWPLLLVRVLLVVLVGLLLAQPVLKGVSDGTPWVVVAPGVALPEDRSTAAARDARWHWLEPGFPAVDDDNRPGVVTPGSASPTSLLRELDATLPPAVALTVLVPPELGGVDAARPVLTRRVDWRVVASDPSGASVGRDRAGEGGSLPAPPGVRDLPPAVSVRHAADPEPALHYIRAALAAWEPAPRQGGREAATKRHDIAPAGQTVPASAKHLIWLAAGDVPPAVCAWIRAGGVALFDAAATPCAVAPARVLWRDESGEPTLEEVAYGRGRSLRFTRELAPASMPVLLDGAFAVQLRALFEPLPVAPARVRAEDHAPAVGGAAYLSSPRELAPWLIVLAALMLLVERAMASGRRRGGEP
ncbi:BatA domain-containing protein [Cognatilysobacter bugurensis]|uniref:Membrane protein n=1 Tax=Cognatilysobacter bugurensis TaxID=543356 RepID=A0A918SXF0_9GAMM|nr:BatA domain-containing protein [Lysobacter bugurensis]GHA73816.1 membrane protein [Lysobacter bugurensis]